MKMNISAYLSGFLFAIYILPLSLTGQARGDTISYIQLLNIHTGRIDTLLRTTGHFEAPNWHINGYLILNSYGKLYTLDIATKNLVQLAAGSFNNDHGISPDNEWLAVSHGVQTNPPDKGYQSAISIMPVKGGKLRRITENVPSYWHGWSPDGKTLAYCAERNGEWDVYTIPVAGGKETRLTNSPGLDDGPDYSPDGKYIYFNSFRTGHMHIWRMLADGSSPQQLTFDKYSNWFPHPSPDNQWIVYLAYTSDEKQGHPFGRQVKLRLMNLNNQSIRDATPVFLGGQGTINVPSWSADSSSFAFVSYSVQ